MKPTTPSPGDPPQDLSVGTYCLSRARENGTCASFLAPTWHPCREVGTAGRPEDVGTGAVNGCDQARQQRITDDGTGCGRPPHRGRAANLPDTPTFDSVPASWHRSTGQVPTCLARDIGEPDPRLAATEVAGGARWGGEQHPARRRPC